jgi:hypothetical protein
MRIIEWANGSAGCGFSGQMLVDIVALPAHILVIDLHVE